MSSNFLVIPTSGGIFSIPVAFLLLILFYFLLCKLPSLKSSWPFIISSVALYVISREFLSRFLKCFSTIEIPLLHQQLLASYSKCFSFR